MAEKNWTGPNPTDRRKAGSKYHRAAAQSAPINVILIKANRHDITPLLPLADGVQPI